MAYNDPSRKKSTDGFKVRLSDYDEKRLSDFLERSGGQAAVIGREALIEFLDRQGITYGDSALDAEMQRRILAGRVIERMKQMAENSEHIDMPAQLKH